MQRIQVAHIREQGVDLVIVPLGRSFDHKTPSHQVAVKDELQRCATSAGLRGTVVPVWETAGGRMRFLAPRPYHPFFRSIDLLFVAANINRELVVN